MIVYLDTSILVSTLYEEVANPEQAEAVGRLFSQFHTRRVQGLVTFYTLPELHSYVVRHYSEQVIDETFRLSLVRLFSTPLIIKPFVDRVELEKLRRRFTISDAGDVYHVAAALFFECSGIITFDHHFRQVSNLIPVYTPDEFLATLESAPPPE